MLLKDVVTEEILKEYSSKGLEAALRLGSIYLVQAETGEDIREEKSIIKGELAEATLLCQLKELQKKLSFETIVAKGIFIQDTKTDKVTELDVTFITPSAIYLIECKSYSGSFKEVQGSGELYRRGKLIADVFGQNMMHLTLFNNRYGGYVAKGSKPYRLVVYDYATNKFHDNRDIKQKNVMPVLNEETFFNWIVNDLRLAVKKGKIVNLPMLKRALINDVKKRDKLLSSEHKRQLKY